MFDAWSLLTGIGMLLAIPIVVGLICLNVYAADRKPPEGLFPLNGRWLRYFFDGFGVVLLVLTSPFWIWFVVPVYVVGWVFERIDALWPERRDTPLRAESTPPVIPRTEMGRDVDLAPLGNHVD